MTLFAVLFEAPLSAAAVAGGAVAVPVVIHLLNRRRFRVVEWAAMRFLLAAQRKNSRRMRIEQLLLLLVRCLIVLLVVAAMASVTGWAESFWRWLNPEGGRGLLASGARTHKVLVLDGSFSMATKHGDATAFELARQKALDLVEKAGGGDGFSVVLMAAPPRRLVPEPSEDIRRVADVLRAARLTHGNADLAGTLATVASLLKSSPGKYPAKEVYFLTDLQRSNWVSGRPGDLAASFDAFKQAGAKAVFVDVGRDGVNNLAVTHLELGDPVATTRTRTLINATLFNHGPARDDLQVRLLVGKALDGGDDQPCVPREVEVRPAKVGKDQMATVAFSYRFPAPGDYVVQVQAAADDLPLDDRRGAIVRVRDTVPVLLVNGKPANELFDRATQWARVALSPYEEGTALPPTAVFRPRVLTQAQFSNDRDGDLSDYDAVFLCDVPQVTDAEARRLEAHVRRGGAVVVSLGDRVDLGSYNRTLFKGGEGLLPARLERIARAPDGWSYKLAIPPEADRHDPLRVFQGNAAREQLLRPFFRAFVVAEPARAVRGVAPRQVLAFAPQRLQGTRGQAEAPPGGAAVLEWAPPLAAERPESDAEPRREVRGPAGRGRVVLVTTTLNADWNRWGPSPAYPPFLQEVVYYAAAARLRERALLVGEVIELFLPSAASVEATFELPADPAAPRGGDDDRAKVNSRHLGDGNVLRFADTSVSGLYKMTIGSRKKEHLFAVNVPSASEDYKDSESNLARTSRDELERTYPGWDLQVVTQLGEVQHAEARGAAGETIHQPQGGPIAHALLLIVLVLVGLEVLMAWQFGHYTGIASLPGDQAAPSRWASVLKAAPWALFAALGVVGFVLVHASATGDFLGFLPEGLRAAVESYVDVAPPAPGESRRWRLEMHSFLVDGKTDPYLIAGGLLAALVAVAFIYRQEGTGIGRGFRALLVGLRLGVLLMLLVVFLPQVKSHVERQGWPDVVILIDTSASMSTHDVYRDERVKAAAEALAGRGELTEDEKLELARAVLKRPGVAKASRLRLGQTALTKDGDAWLLELLERRQVRVHVYSCSGRAARLADATTVDEVPAAVRAIKALSAPASNDSSQLGAALRQVLNDFRGSSLAAVIMVTDGVTTEGEDLAKVSKYAASLDVPLFFLGVGDSQEVRDLYLHDLQAEDSVYVGDNIVFEVQLTHQGFTGGSVNVTLHEKGKDAALATSKPVPIDGNKTVKVRLQHKPMSPGEKTYVIRVPVQEGEVDKDNNALEKQVFVREAKTIKVLYVEGYRRYEYHYLKTLLERESNRLKGNKTIVLRVLLLDADAGFPKQDSTAIADFPTPLGGGGEKRSGDDDDLNSYDVVILGDIDPESRGDRKTAEFLKHLAGFVQERGGGLVVLAGERYSPQALFNSPLKDVLPIDKADGKPAGLDADDVIQEGYRPELTPAGKSHPMFRFDPDEDQSAKVWAALKEIYWFAEGYVPKRAAEVMAVHPTLKAAQGNDKHPLIVQHFAGAGRCLFLGINETWRWNWREDQGQYNQFWFQTMRYLARSKVGRVELRLDRQTPYRRGEPIRVTVRFPDDERPPADKADVRVQIERRLPGRPNDVERSVISLTKLEGSRATYEAVVTQTPEGEYRFTLVEPLHKPRPQAEAKVLAPPGEMERLRMNQAEMEAASAATHGKFYTLADFDKLAGELPRGRRVAVNVPGLPWIVWNASPLFVLLLALLTTEWLMRKQKNLL